MLVKTFTVVLLGCLFGCQASSSSSVNADPVKDSRKKYGFTESERPKNLPERIGEGKPAGDFKGGYVGKDYVDVYLKNKDEMIFDIYLKGDPTKLVRAVLPSLPGGSDDIFEKSGKLVGFGTEPTVIFGKVKVGQRSMQPWILFFRNDDNDQMSIIEFEPKPALPFLRR